MNAFRFFLAVSISFSSGVFAQPLSDVKQDIERLQTMPKEQALAELEKRAQTTQMARETVAELQDQLRQAQETAENTKVILQVSAGTVVVLSAISAYYFWRGYHYGQPNPVMIATPTNSHFVEYATDAEIKAFAKQSNIVGLLVAIVAAADVAFVVNRTQALSVAKTQVLQLKSDLERAQKELRKSATVIDVLKQQISRS